MISGFKACHKLCLHIEITLILCFRLFHKIAPLANRNKYPNVDFLVSENFLCSFPMFNSWITLVSSQDTDCKANIGSYTSLIIHKISNMICITNFFSFSSVPIHSRTLHKVKVTPFLNWHYTNFTITHSMSFKNTIDIFFLRKT